MKKLYNYFESFGRMGDIESLFIAHPDELEDAYGHTLCFGEALGKHSEVDVDFGPEDVELISTEQDKIEWLYTLMGGPTISGFNPIEKHNDQKDDGVYDND